MYTFIDDCPRCHATAVAVTFRFQEGHSPTFTDPGEGDAVFDIKCSHCLSLLDDHEEIVRACLAAAEDFDELPERDGDDNEW